jgi:histidinol-phosphatase (PHP family)
VELGDPHLHPRVAAALASSGFDLVVGSVHSLRRAAGFADAADRYADLPDAEVVREYLAEVTTMVETSDHFDVLAHINYAARYWPGRQGSYRRSDFEGEYRAALRALAGSGRALEINTSGSLPPDASLVAWWRAEGGQVATAVIKGQRHPASPQAAVTSKAASGPSRGSRTCWATSRSPPTSTASGPR